MFTVKKIIESKKKFEVLINSNSIDYEQFKNFFKKSNTGDSELFFKILYNQYKVEIKSDRLFQFNFNELNLNEGDNVKYYFTVWDNDKINGHKKTKKLRNKNKYLIELKIFSLVFVLSVLNKKKNKVINGK